jgi:hypothetical protein
LDKLDIAGLNVAIILVTKMWSMFLAMRGKRVKRQIMYLIPFASLHPEAVFTHFMEFANIVGQMGMPISRDS